MKDVSNFQDRKPQLLKDSASLIQLRFRLRALVAQWPQVSFQILWLLLICDSTPTIRYDQTVILSTSFKTFSPLSLSE